MKATVKFALESMGFLPYTHIIVRERDSSGITPLGGGYLEKVLRRYGDREIERSTIVGEILYIDLKSSTDSLN